MMHVMGGFPIEGAEETRLGLHHCRARAAGGGRR